jgi:hypothetical protein
MVFPVRKNDETRITAAEIWFMRLPAGCTKWDHKRYEEIMEELKTSPVLEHKAKDRTGEIMSTECIRRRIPKQILQYASQGGKSIGRLAKRWLETLTDHMV